MISEKLNAKFVNDDSNPPFQTGLEKSGNKRAVTHELVEECEQVRVKRQAIKSEVVGELTAENLPCPFIVKMHVAAGGQEQGGGAEARQGNDPDKEGESENVMARAQRGGPDLSEDGRRGQIAHG